MTTSDAQHIMLDTSRLEETPRLLVSIRNPNDRRLVCDYLEQWFTVIRSGFPEVEEKFDLCIIDRPAFRKHRLKIIQYKRSQVPLFSPFILLEKDPSWSKRKESAFDIVDDIIPMPVGPEVLKSRIETLLQTRIYSRQLKEKNATLEEERDRYRLITENATDMIVRNKPEGTFTYVSPSSEKVTGYKPEELLGRSIYEFFHQGDLERLKRTKEKFMSKPGIQKVEFRFNTKEEGFTWMESSVKAVRDDATGEVKEVHGAIRDISDRKNYERELEKERNLFRKLTESSPVGISILDTDGQITFANDQAENILGLSKDKVTERTYNDPEWEITAPDGGPFPEEKLPFPQVMENGESVYDVRHAIVWPDGSRKILSINAAPLKDESGNIEGVIASLNDITKLIEQEQEIQDEKDFIDTAIDSLPEIFYMIDEEQNIVKWNKDFEKKLGYSSEEIRNMHPLDFYRKEDHDKIKLKIGEAFTTGSADTEMSMISKNGKLIPFYITGKKFSRKNRDYLVGACIDLTDIKEAEFEIEKQRQLLHAIINQADSIIYVKDKDGKFILVNDAYLELMELERQDIIGKTAGDIHDEEHAEKAVRHDRKVRESGKLLDFEEQTTIKGEKRYYHTIKYPLKGVPGLEECICGISTEITGRKEALQKLRERIKEQACLYNISELKEQNHTIPKLLKRAVEYLPEGWQYPEITEAAISFDGNVYQTENYRETKWSQVAERETYAGKPLTVRVVYTRDTGQEGEGVFLEEERSLLNAITDTLAEKINNKEATRRLKNSEKRWERLVENMPVMIQIISTDGKLLYINPHGTSLYGTDDPEQFLGRHLSEFVTFEDTENVNDRINSLSKGEIVEEKIHKITDVNGEEHYIEVQSIPITYHNQKAIQTVGKDVTERVKYEKELKQSLREKEVLLQEIHHRVKNNLAVVSGMMQLQRFSSDNEELNSILSNSEMRIKSMALIHEKLYSSGTLSEIDLQYYVEDLAKTIRDTIQTDKEIDLKYKCDNIKLNVNQAVPCALIINELISNAYKHAFKGRDGGEITIAIREQDAFVEVEVNDDGVGIDEKVIEGGDYSMGYTIIETLISQLDSTLSITNGTGTHVSFRFKKKNIRGAASSLIN